MSPLPPLREGCADLVSNDPPSASTASPATCTPCSIGEPCGASSSRAAISSANGREDLDALCVWRGAALAEGQARWRALEAELGAPLAASSAWTETWVQHYGDQQPTSILTLDRQGRTVGCCLVAEGAGQSAGPIPLRTRHLGAAGEPPGSSVCVEYNDVLAAPGQRRTFIERIAAHLRAASDWDEIRLDGVLEGQLSDWRALGTPDALHIRRSPYFDLCAAREQGGDPFDALGRSTRQNLRRRLRQYGDLELLWSESRAEAESIFEELVVLHQARWTASGRPGAFANSKFLSFQRTFLARGFEEGRVVLFRVRCGGMTVGALMLLVDRGRLLDYLSGFAAFDRFGSPGLVTHALGLRGALERGYSAYDFLVGEKRHKDNLSNAEQSLAWAVWRGRTWRNRLVRALRRFGASPTMRPDGDIAAPSPDEAAADKTDATHGGASGALVAAAGGSVSQ